ncbi:MAG: YihY/virulence factor BrkB family protein [Bifidobacteriaceae bacterium]|nr:YihY/virulence factor BrkB family protein [Bifidobacteriaceae bacterium]
MPKPAPRTTKIAATVRRAAKWWGDTRAGRTLERYSRANGSLLAGGIAYSALFSLVAVLTIALTTFAAVLGGDPELDKQVEAQLSSWFPGVLKTGGQGLVAPSSWIKSGALSVTSLVAALVLVWSALAAMSAVQTGVRAMFELGPKQGGAAWTRRLWALVGFAGLGAGLLASSVVSVGAASAGEWAAHALHAEGAAVAIRWAGYAVSLVVDAACVGLVFTVVAGARPSRRDLMIGSLAAAAAMGVLKHLGTRVVAHATANALLASATTVVTLLVWVNLMARVVLYAAAWTAAAPSVSCAARSSE